MGDIGKTKKSQEQGKRDKRKGGSVERQKTMNKGKGDRQQEANNKYVSTKNNQ